MLSHPFKIPAPLLFFFLLLLWLILPFITASVGSLHLSIQKSLTIMAQIYHLIPSANLESDPAYTIIQQLRLPRSLLALLCGGSLAVSGAILQGVLKNPLADPFTLGISSGAACGASMILGYYSSISNLPFSLVGLTTCAAFSGALAAMILTLILGRAGGSYQKENLVLAGIAVASFLGAIVTLIKALNEESVTSIVFWLMGSLQGRSWETLPVMLAVMTPAGLILFLSWRKLDILSLGDEQARLLGLSCGQTRYFLLFAASLLTAATVAFCGIIAFIGLVVPHVTRLLMGASHGLLLTCSFFGGGIFLLLADCLSRVILDGGQELPVGVITALTGGPFFAFLVWKRQ